MIVTLCLTLGASPPGTFYDFLEANRRRPDTSAELPFLLRTPEVPADFSAKLSPFQLSPPSSWEYESRSDVMPGMRKEDRWQYKAVTESPFYRLTTQIEHPDPARLEVIPDSSRRWRAEERLQIPLPVETPFARQMYLYGQFTGNGDSFDNRQTTLNGKTGFGMKWSVLGSSELQLRYASIFEYAEVYSENRFQERTRPAVELIAKTPLIGTLSVEYTGSALPGLTRQEPDRLRQELRFALPFYTDSEFELGARYQWDILSTANAVPWYDRAQLFLGLRFRH